MGYMCRAYSTNYGNIICTYSEKLIYAYAVPDFFPGFGGGLGSEEYTCLSGSNKRLISLNFSGFPYPDPLL